MRPLKFQKNQAKFIKINIHQNFRTIVSLYCYIHNVSADMSSGLHLVFLVELWSLHGTSNHVLYLIHGDNVLWFHLPYPGTSEVFLYCYSPAVRNEPSTPRWLSLAKLRVPRPITYTKHLYAGMVNGFRACNPRGLNKGRGSKFRFSSRVRQETLEEGRRTYRPKCCEYNNKDEDNCPKTLNDKIIKLRLRNSDS